MGAGYVRPPRGSRGGRARGPAARRPRPRRDASATRARERALRGKARARISPSATRRRRRRAEARAARRPKRRAAGSLYYLRPVGCPVATTARARAPERAAARRAPRYRRPSVMCDGLLPHARRGAASAWVRATTWRLTALSRRSPSPNYPPSARGCCSCSGSEAPAHLDGSMAGDYGCDPFGLALDKDNLKWYREAELQVRDADSCVRCLAARRGAVCCVCGRRLAGARESKPPLPGCRLGGAMLLSGLHLASQIGAFCRAAEC